jgi:hypothetical protein
VGLLSSNLRTALLSNATKTGLGLGIICLGSNLELMDTCDYLFDPISELLFSGHLENTLITKQSERLNDWNISNGSICFSR